MIPLMKQLIESGYTLLLETSGERPLQRVPPAVFKIVDVKCPDSGEGESFRLENLAAISQRDEIKFVIASRADYEFAREFIVAHELWRKAGNVIFSPAFRKEASGSRDVANCLHRSAGAGGVDTRGRTARAAWACKFTNSSGIRR